MNESNLFKRHPLKAITLLLLLFFGFVEIALHILFAFKAYPVGTLAPSWFAFKPVDSLEVWESFYTDENGIYKANLDYWIQPEWKVNSEGFRGREFIPDTLNDSAATLLFIGDSYTWGAHAKPPDSCFVNLLEEDRKYVCYNAGIPGTDPAQYAEVARLYVPRLNPKVTLVMLYLGNDLMDSGRAITPFKNIYYQTSAGWLPVTYKGHNFSSARESYQYVMHKFSPQSFLESVFLKTATGTAVLTFPLRMEEYIDWYRKKNSPVTNDYLKQIKTICERYNSSYHIFIIPREADLDKQFYENPVNSISNNYPTLSKGLEESIYVIPFRKEHLYPQPDGHLNNAGHAFAAKFIRGVLEKQ